MKHLISSFTFGLMVFISGSCSNTPPEQHSSAAEYNAKAANPQILHAGAQKLTDVIVYDIFKPPVASRIYAYSYLSAYEVLRQKSETKASMAGKLKGFGAVPEPDKELEYCFPLASIKAFVTVGKALTYSHDIWEPYEKEILREFREAGIPEEVYSRSEKYGRQVAEHILKYADQDHYKTTRGIRHTIKHTEGSWVPTPPAYAEACEPQWNKVRLFTLDSARQFAPPPPATFDMSENSKFHQLITEVYALSKNLTEEQKAIAYFWDDNAFVTNIVGHATFTEKKMTPPGHWLEITRTVAQNKQLNMMDALEAYTLTSVALFDAFIASWDAKYQTDRIRPVTVINNHFDQDWMPFLETPAFPEYVSAHSAISASAGKVLTHLFGENVAFTDSTEHKYGHGVRSFDSFEQAYWETSESRIYGGIHYRDGIEQGTYQGEKIGDWVWNSLKGTQDPVELKASAK